MSVPVLPAYVLPGQSYVNQEGTTVHVPPDPSGSSELRTQLTGNLSGALKGELPADVKQLLQQEAAQNAVSSGVSGSQFANYQGLRTLGLTSLNRMQNAENSLVNPLLGYHPLQILPRQEPGAPAPPSNIHWGGTAPTSIGPAPTGNYGNRSPTLPNYQQGGAGTSSGNVLTDLLSKYGPGAGAGGGSSWNTTTNWNAGGDWNAGANAPWNNPGGGSANAGFGAGGGSTYFGNPDEAAALQEQQQNLIGAGFNPVDFGYQNSDLNAAMAEQAQNLQYSDLNPTDFGYG